MVSMSTVPNVAFIGGGNMARALIGGMTSKGHPGERIWVADSSPAKAQSLSERFGVRVASSLGEAVNNAQVVVLAVKPQAIDALVDELAQRDLVQGRLFISIAAGVAVSRLQARLGKACAVVRLMPNMPVSIGYGMCGLYANAHTSSEQKRLAMAIAQSCGDCLEVHEEAAIDSITALSGSGPAYFFLVMEAMIRAGTRLGLSVPDARRLTCQAARGAAQLVLLGDEDPAELRRQVTSAGGTTQAAIDLLLHADVPSLVEAAVSAAHDRAVELGRLAG